MIKKLFLCAALVGAVGLTSCVDDVESASVQAIRNAKAEQLKAAADLDKANAEAAIITANAQQKVAETGAATAAAQAELVKAEAALKQAQAAQIAAQTESDKAIAAAQVEQMMAEVERTKAQVAELQAKLKMLIAQYEKQIAEYQYQAEEQRQKLEDLIADRKDKRLETLVGNYNQAVSDLAELQVLLNEATFEKSKYEAGITDDAYYLNTQILILERQNTQYNQDITDKKAWIEMINTANVQAAIEKLPELKAQLVERNTKRVDAQTESQSKQNAYNLADNALTNSDYTKAAQNIQYFKVSDASHYGKALYQSSVTITIDGKTKTLVPYFTATKPQKDTYMPWNSPGVMNASDYTVQLEKKDKDGTTVNEYISIFSNLAFESKRIDFTYGPAANSSYEEYKVYSADNYYTLLQADKLIAEAEANVTAINAGLEFTTDSLENASKILTDLEDAWDKYVIADNNNKGIDPTNTALVADRQDKYEKAYNKLWGLMQKADPNVGTPVKYKSPNWNKTWYDAIPNKYNFVMNGQKNDVANATAKNNSVKEALAYATQYAEGVKKDLTTMKSNAAGLPKLIDDANATGKAYAEARVAYTIANGEWSIVNNQVTACNQIISGAGIGDIETEIENANKQITRWEELIASNKVEIENYKNQLQEGEFKNQQNLADAQANIDSLTEQVAAQQKVVDAAKAALDAALAAE